MEMGASVCQFSEKNPSADPSFLSVLGRLKEAVNRLRALADQQAGGFNSKHASSVHRREVRQRLRDGLLRHLVTVAEDAASEKPELLEKFVIPARHLSTARFQTLARTMLEQGKAEQELLVKHGLTATLLDDLAATIGEFDASVSMTVQGKQDHVLARKEMHRVSEEVLLLVSMMDGINRYRFQRDPQLLAAWKSAKHVVTGPQAAKVENPETPAGPVQGGPGEVKPAA
jgi:hypothetical protein